MTALPSVYAASRERRRRAQLWIFTLFLLVSDASMILKVGYWVGVIPPVVALACLIVAVMSRIGQGRIWDLSIPPTWPAQVPAWLLRAHAVALRGRLRDTTELTGRLHLLPDRLEWRPSAGSVRLGATTMTWPLSGLRGMSVIPLWGLVPMSLLHVDEQDGSEADIWLRASSVIVSKSLAATEGSTTKR